MSRQKIILTAPAPILPGSLTTVWAPCGKQNCCCFSDTTKHHGPYYRWTGLIDGKRTTVALSPELFKECQKRINNYRLLLTQLDRTISQALKNAPWNMEK